MFESYIEVRDCEVILFTEFITKEGEKQVENYSILGNFDTIKQAEHFVKWYEDNGAKVIYTTTSGMSICDDEQYF